MVTSMLRLQHVDVANATCKCATLQRKLPSTKSVKDGAPSNSSVDVVRRKIREERARQGRERVGTREAVMRR